MANPVKMLVHRPDFHKFNLAELNLNITENPGTVSHGHHGHDSDRERVKASLVTINKDKVPYLGLICNNQIAILPKTFPYTQRQTKELVNSGRSKHDDPNEIMVKISKSKYTFNPYKFQVDSWFRVAADKRIEGASIVNINNLPHNQTEEVFIDTNTEIPFFNYLAAIVGSPITVRV